MAQHCQPAFCWLEGSEEVANFVWIAGDRALDHSLQRVHPISCNVALVAELTDRLGISGRAFKGCQLPGSGLSSLNDPPNFECTTVSSPSAAIGPFSQVWLGTFKLAPLIGTVLR